MFQQQQIKCIFFREITLSDRLFCLELVCLPLLKTWLLHHLKVASKVLCWNLPSDQSESLKVFTFQRRQQRHSRADTFIKIVANTQTQGMSKFILSNSKQFKDSTITFLFQVLLLTFGQVPGPPHHLQSAATSQSNPGKALPSNTE